MKALIKAKNNLSKITICCALIVNLFSVGTAYFVVTPYHGRFVEDIWSNLYSASWLILFIIVISYACVCVKNKEKPKICMILITIILCLTACGCNSSIQGNTFMYSDVKFVESAWDGKEAREYIYMIEDDPSGALQMFNLSGEELNLNKNYLLVDGLYFRSIFGQQFWIKKVICDNI